jgi:hypothetical protein
MNMVLLLLALTYFAAIGIVIIFFARHFIGWLNNTIPSAGRSGFFVEIFSMFFNHCLTKRGREHKNKSIRWLGVFIIMVIAFTLVIARLKR